MTANLCKSSMRDSQQQNHCDDKLCYQSFAFVESEEHRPALGNAARCMMFTEIQPTTALEILETKLENVDREQRLPRPHPLWRHLPSRPLFSRP